MVRLAVLSSILVATTLVAESNQSPLESEFFKPQLVSYQENNTLLALPNQPETSIKTGVDPDAVSIRMSETGDRRKYSVTHKGETYRAEVPATGTRSHLAFDMNRKKFVSLLPSIRVSLAERSDLDPQSQADEIARSLDAIDFSMFESLGFAIIHLPSTTHPADAIRVLESSRIDVKAYVRVRRPPVRWR